MRISPSRLRIAGAILVVALVIALTSSAATGSFPLWLRHAVPAPAAAPSTANSSSPRPSGHRTSDTLPPLSPAQLAGQRVIYSYGGLKPPSSLLQLIRHGEAAGVIFFSQNVSSSAQLAKVIVELDQASDSPQNPVHEPLLLMTDQEGGEIRRVPGPPLLSEQQIGDSADPPAQAANAGTTAASNLRGMGLTVNLAPVIDVYRQPDDFDEQFGRSYSTNPSVVARLGADFITAQQRAGVAATAKHFPGLGTAARQQDTDEQPVTLNVPLATIRNTDELPYYDAIAAGVKLVMVSWAVYPALDPHRPAGLSSTIVGGELRQRLRFGGVTITDALEAGALRPYGPVSNRALLAAEAGMDLLLASQRNVHEGEQAAAGLEAGYHDGALGKPAYTAALQRVLALRASLAAG
ncbi:MAG TPA: glycoside hydrolase family 3 N-terminal domain-containing protein [Streptosporangiaceae bacterium]|nr:glycoside hydrolase family 3 N-terminal domain-containing protein [Streptosporangiaceae bacterium]